MHSGYATHQGTNSFLTHWFYYFQYSRVKPIVTPRFALSCSETMLAELGNIAKTRDLHIQVGIFLFFVLLPDLRGSSLSCILAISNSTEI